MSPAAATEIGERHTRLLERLSRAATAAGRDASRCRIVAITKGFGIDVARDAVAAGLSRLGENRVQEALAKVAALPAVEWHLVGHLQSNKVRRAVEAFDWIHSIDSLELLARVDRAAGDAGRSPAVLLQVNITDEASKSGFAAARLARAAAPGGNLTTALAGLRHARVVGLMAIGRDGADHRQARDTFRELRALRDRLEQSLGRPLPELSMGMSADCEQAVAEGATLVRIGRALFGQRPAA